MGSGLLPYNSRADLLASDGRRLGRALSRKRAETYSRQADIDVAAELTEDKIEVATLATGSGLSAVGRVARAQEQLELMAPTASARMNLLADQHALGVADELQNLWHRLRRI